MDKLGVSNKKIKQVTEWQRSSKDRREAGIFIVEGIKMFREAPSAWVREVYLTESVYRELGDVPYPYYVVEDSAFEKMSDTRTPQGILTVLTMPHYDLDDLIANGKNGCNPLLLILENLQDPGNLGTILRVGEAAGVTGIIMSKGTVDIFNPKVVRATMGSIYRMAFTTADDLPKVLEKLRAVGIETYAAHLKGAAIFTDYDYKKPTAFMIGNEGNGLTDEITAMADRKLFIPMEGSVESLNAGIASAVLVYEAHRQRNI